MLVGLLLVLAGFVLLTLGAESLVRGAASLALRMGVSSLAVGLTVVAFGTSMPEMVVSVQAALGGVSEIAIGNVVGSNIVNIAVILGVAAVICPIPCHTNIVRREAPLMVGATVLVMAIIWWNGFTTGGNDEIAGTLTRTAGVVLTALILAYTFFTYHAAKRESAQHLDQLKSGLPAVGPEEEARQRSVLLDLVLMVVGLALLAGGAHLLVDGAVRIARLVGVSELVIGLTIVAAGTSMPELATTAVAALRGQPDISVGNAVGSSMFNLLAILGVTSMVRPIPVPHVVLYQDLPVALLLAALCIPLMYTGGRLSRLEGAFFLLLYGGYLSLLFIRQ